MAGKVVIGKDQVVAVADSMLVRKEKVTVDNVMAGLGAQYGSKGNRNAVAKALKEWRNGQGIASAPARTVAKSAPVAEKPTIIDKLPAAIRQPLIALITAIVDVIGRVRNEERLAATELVDNARRNDQQEVGALRSALTASRAENQQLNAEILALREQLEQKNEQQAAEDAAKLMDQFSQFIRSGAFLMADNNVQASGRADKRK
jgi:hypothetical protein